MNTQENAGLAGKNALVTGGTTGIGRATVELLRAAGARVALTGVSADTLSAARRELPEEVLVVRSDARSPGDATELATTLAERFGQLDVVFLNAGIALLSPFEALTEAHYNEQFDVNVKGVVFTLHRLLPLLAPGASVIVCTSVADQRGTAGMSVYSATKGAVAAEGRRRGAGEGARGGARAAENPREQRLAGDHRDAHPAKIRLTAGRRGRRRRALHPAHPTRALWSGRGGGARGAVPCVARGLLRHGH
jgi:NAD(P)-dependent dehydrogenase (short-subunit alcohol dehydrogenase family)